MPANAKLALLPGETAEPPVARRDAPQERPKRPAETPSALAASDDPRARVPELSPEKRKLFPASMSSGAFMAFFLLR